MVASNTRTPSPGVLVVPCSTTNGSGVAACDASGLRVEDRAVLATDNGVLTILGFRHSIACDAEHDISAVVRTSRGAHSRENDAAFGCERFIGDDR